MRQSLVVILCALAGASSAQAAIVNATFTGVAPGGTANITPNGNVGAGQYDFTYNYGDLNWLAPSYGAFCIEIQQAISVGQTVTFDVVPITDAPSAFGPAGMGAARADRLAELFGRHYVDSDTSNENAVAFGIAVWEIVNDDSLNLNAGAFTTVSTNPAGAKALASIWLAEIDGTGPRASLLALRSDKAQDYVIVNNDVPATGTLAIAPIGALAAARRRRR